MKLCRSMLANTPVADIPVSRSQFLVLPLSFHRAAKNASRAPSRKNIPKGARKSMEPRNISRTAGTSIWQSISTNTARRDQNTDFMSLSIFMGFIVHHRRVILKPHRLKRCGFTQRLFFFFDPVGTAIFAVVVGPER